ncbi:uncharacterized protein BXZ73DRAFT_93680 [Epithele typhae]|uniref:uncharacterized protein n=1 Tax=Epithele typhae TaxID=378194 RepID=UPI002007F832|nr:uncharacterized protein BXZ73DRAFT_93680 [Epithele typhae]KAH9910516.1 hypothetical protein BXZ73DRAFT_93680 [Epithele typhae]
MSVRGPSISATVISLAYQIQTENLGPLAIIPGPREPHGVALNHYLRPIVDVLLTAWIRGIKHCACVSRSAVAAVVMDLQAARHASQMARHNGHHYCHVCTCYHQSTRGRTDFEHWTKRNLNELREQAERWRDATTEAERKRIFNEHGIRWSELWRLPYWDPTRQLVVDPMHCILEGLVLITFGTSWA